MIRRFVKILLFAGLLASCSNNGQKNMSNHPINLTKQQLININKRLLQNEKKEIDNFVKSHGWKMKTTSTGLRYMILKHGNGPHAMKGKVATIAYSEQLISGLVVHSSDKEGLKSFEIGHSDVVAGLEEGIILLKVGDKAKFILPSHLAYGLSGDGDKVPPNIPIIYTVELVNLN